jgi:hypothetical protein
MILAADGDRLRVITQPDHARFAGELVRLWRADGLPDHPRREEFLLAVREHDNGWREADSAPRVDAATGRPVDFLAFPPAERREVWRRGTARYAATHPYAALLITEHALALFAGPATSEDASLQASLAQLREELQQATAATVEELHADYRLLHLADGISLAACAAWREPFERAGTRVELRDTALLLRPFPLAGSTTFRVPCRFIPDRRYRGDADLGGTLAAARWEDLPVRVAPLETG